MVVVQKTTSTDACALIAKAGSAGNQYEWDLVQWNPQTYIGTTRVLGTGSGIAVATAASAVTTGEHVVGMTMDYSAKMLIVYCDGIEIARQAVWSGTSSDGTGPLCVGQRGDNAQYGDQTVSRASVFNRILTAADMRYLDQVARGG